MTIEIANRLVELRKKHNLSQEELAEKLGVSRQAISKWERGEASPDTDNLIELAKIYNVSIDELLGTSTSKNTNDNEEKNDTKTKTSSIHISNEGLHIIDDEDEINITKDGVDISEGDNKQIVKYHFKKNKVKTIVSIIVLFGTTIAYILLGAILHNWSQAWVLFLLITIIPSIFDAIDTKNPAKFNYAVLVTFIYLLLCCWVFNFALWHPLWVVFLTIPIYYGVCQAFREK